MRMATFGRCVACARRARATRAGSLDQAPRRPRSQPARLDHALPARRDVLLHGQYEPAANAFHEALNGDMQPRWVEVWSHLNPGKIFDMTGQRERALNEYRQAQRTGDNPRGAMDDAATYTQFPYPRK